ncbi:MAG: hypothetical protein ACFFB2_03825 [Promethearchaeota archaeon]
MIRKVFIIHESGLCLLSRSYGDESDDVDLFSGFLAAISSFAKNMIGEKINEIRMEHHSIFYESRETIVLALVTSEKQISKRKLFTTMRRIYSKFIQQYQEYLNQKIVEPSLFKDFRSSLDNILQTSGLVELKHPLIEGKVISSIY